MRDTFPNKCLSLFFHQKPPIFDYLSHQSKYIRCGPLYLFKTSSYLYVKSLYPRCYLIYIIVLSNRYFHRSTRVNRPYHLGEQASSLLCNDLFTRVER